MKYGAGVLAAKQAGAAELVDPRPFTVGTLSDTFAKYPGIGVLLPAMGYSDQQVEDLQTTINATDCEAVVVGTPIDLSRIVKITKPFTRVTYDLEPTRGPNLKDLVAATAKRVTAS
jgi:predicted GTPase